MENENKTIFIDGMSFSERSTQQPEWILGKISVNLNRFMPFLKANVDDRGWLNIDLKKSQKGETYLALNTWKPTARTADSLEDKKFEESINKPEYTGEDKSLEDIPF